MTKKSPPKTSAETEGGPFGNGAGRIVVAADSMRMPVVFTDAHDPAHPIIFANDGILSLTGHLRDELLGQSFYSLIAEDADVGALSAIKRGFHRKSGIECEVKCRRKNGSDFWAALFINPVLDEKGKITRHFASFHDLTRHKQEQAHAKMLIDELNHRVKNMLTTVQSIVREALSTNADQQALRQVIKLRLSALSRSHDLLTREKWKGAGLREIVNASLEPFKAPNDVIDRFFITGEDIRFSPKAALALGIVFNELATNALKYGALSTTGGTVHIEWKREPSPRGPRILLTWREAGGPRVTVPAHRGFGTRVIERGLSHELGGTGHIDYLPEGVLCTIKIPAPDKQNE